MPTTWSTAWHCDSAGHGRRQRTMGRDHDSVRRRSNRPSGAGHRRAEGDRSRVARAGRCGVCARGFAARRGRAQIVHGNPARAGSSVDALSRGDAPPPRRRRRPHAPAGTGVTTPSARAARSVIARGDWRQMPRSARRGWSRRWSVGRAVLGRHRRVCARRPPLLLARRKLGRQRPDISVLRLSALDVVAIGAGRRSGRRKRTRAAADRDFSRKRPEHVPSAASVVLDSAGSSVDRGGD